MKLLNLIVLGLGCGLVLADRTDLDNVQCSLLSTWQMISKFAEFSTDLKELKTKHESLEKKLSDSFVDGFEELKNITRDERESLEECRLTGEKDIAKYMNDQIVNMRKEDKNYLETQFSAVTFMLTQNYQNLKEEVTLLDKRFEALVQQIINQFDEKLDKNLKENYNEVATSQANSLTGFAQKMENQMNAISAELTAVKTVTERQNRITRIQFMKALHEAGLKPFILPSGKVIVFPTESKYANFTTANSFCKDLGMTLVTAKNQQALDEYYNAATRIDRNDPFWLSASNLDDGGANFKWEDGTPLPVDSNLWHTTQMGARADQPDDYKNESEACVYIHTGSGIAKLADAPCRYVSLFGLFACEL